MKTEHSTRTLLILTCLILATLTASSLQARDSSHPVSKGTPRQPIPLDLSGPQVIADGLVIPWAIDFLPDGNMLVTERGTGGFNSAINLLNPDGDVLRRAVFSDVIGPSNGEGGLLGIAVDPQFAQNRYVYTYATYSTSSGIQNRVSRWKFSESHVNLLYYPDGFPEYLAHNIPGSGIHNGGRLKFGPDGFLYATTGDAADPALSPDLTSLAGKILRFDTSEIGPADPASVIHSYGHRNPQGLAWDEFGQLWSTEHGSSGKDEINFIFPAENYGWPDSSGDVVQPGTIQPFLHSGQTTWAPASAAYYDGYLFFGGLGFSSTYARSLYRYEIATGMLEKFYTNVFGRIREVVLGPTEADGKQYLFFTTSNTPSGGTPAIDRILKVDPDVLGPFCGPYTSPNGSPVWLC